MVCCCVPCFHKLQKRFDPVPGTGPFTLCVTELLRWIVIVGILYLTTWRYAELTSCYSFDYTQCPQNITSSAAANDSIDYAAFWGIVTAIVLTGSLLVYWPFKIIALRWRKKNDRLKDHRWRPSILTYIVACAVPCLVIIAVASDDTRKIPDSTMDAATTTTLQVMVLGLTFTEWMSKLREEHFTYDLITAMSVDFFFAYDVIQFLMMCTYEKEVFHSDWFYVCFVFAFIAMFRYIPTQPTDINQEGAPEGAAIVILVSMFCVDIPFVVVRLWTMIEFGLIVSDLIHPIKNIALIFFGITQLWIIHTHSVKQKKAAIAQANEIKRQRMELVVPEKRRSRYPVCVWSREHGAMICTWDSDSQELPNVTRDRDLSRGSSRISHYAEESNGHTNPSVCE